MVPSLPAVLIDECLPRHFRGIFAQRGWTVYAVGEHFSSGSSDLDVIATALDIGAVVVTSDADFRQLRHAAYGHIGRLESADRIFFKKCTHSEALARIIELMDVVEAEYQYAKRNGRKFSMHITPQSFTIHR